MTYDEMFKQAQDAAKLIAATTTHKQRWFMPEDELIVLLMDAYGKGFKAGTDKTVLAFAPEKYAEYLKACA